MDVKLASFMFVADFSSLNLKLFYEYPKFCKSLQRVSS